MISFKLDTHYSTNFNEAIWKCVGVCGGWGNVERGEEKCVGVWGK